MNLGKVLLGRNEGCTVQVTWRRRDGELVSARVELRVASAGAVHDDLQVLTRTGDYGSEAHAYISGEGQGAR